jgi:hypothetical protein
MKNNDEIQLSVLPEGIKYWHKKTENKYNIIFHNENGPAIEWPDGSECWYKDNLLHNENGPAVKYADGSEEYWLNGKQYTKEQYYNELEKNNKKKNKESVKK